MTQRPLAVPPSFSLAAPGSVTTGNPARPVPANEAANAILGDQPAALASAGWQQFASALGVQQRNPAIRTQLNKDNQVAPQRDPDFADRLAIWQKQHPADPVVDAPLEAQRLKSKGAKNNSQVPTQGGKVKAPLANIF